MTLDADDPSASERSGPEIADSGAAATRAPRSGALVFVGFMGAGKTVAARAVAAALDTVALDADRELERELGEPIDAVFARDGEPRFREHEERLILELLDRPDARVVSLGGGAVGSERVRDALARHTVIHLEVETDDAWRRAAGRGRPLARDKGEFKELHERRRVLYESVADVTLLPSDRGAAVRALDAMLALAEAPAGTTLEWARAGSAEYPVFVGRGLLAAGFFHPQGARRFVVTDENVVRHHELPGEREVIPAGELAKSLATTEAVLRSVARAGLTRDDLIVALGGGVVGDLAGFCAAVYQRGIQYVQVPTTLVSQVDSALGGKTGVDLPEGKNYVGAYHQPQSVLIDPDTLRTLPPQEHAAGYAEVLKTALIAGGTLWAKVRDGRDPDDEVIRRCARTKLAVVAEDERDAGRRQVLNLGHTVAHAIEAATGYARYRHGEAVAIGLLCALRLSGRDALRREVAELLERHGLPVRFGGADPDTVVELVARDKKRRGASVPFVLVDGPGRVTPGHQVADADLRAAVAEVWSGAHSAV